VAAQTNSWPTQIPPPSAPQPRPSSLLDAMQAQAGTLSASATAATETPVAQPPVTTGAPTVSADSPAFSPTFSAGIGSSQSFFSTNKYIFGALLLVAGVVAAILYLR